MSLISGGSISLPVICGWTNVDAQEGGEKEAHLLYKAAVAGEGQQHFGTHSVCGPMPPSSFKATFQSRVKCQI